MESEGGNVVSNTLRIALILGIFVYFVLIFNLLKSGKLLLKYSLAWLGSGGVMLLLVLFPQIIYSVSRFFGIYDGMNGLFVAAFGFVLIILMTITSIVSNQKNKIKRLTQELSYLEKRVRELENRCD